MAKSMVIVESPAKARTIEKYLGKDYMVRASAGHVVDLPPRSLGVDIRADFRPTYKIIPGKEKIIADLKKDSKRAKAIYLAADPDREGEAICYHLAQQLNDQEGREIYRVLFNEITKKAILEAFQHPSSIDQHKVEAQQARRILDRIVGYKISPLLWQKVQKGLSAGRVQTVAVRLIVDREREIRAFKPEEYWDFKALLRGSQPPDFEAKAVKYKAKKFKISNQEEADAVLDELQQVDFIVRDQKKKEKKRRPVPPYITSKLQQDAVRQLGFTVKKTMSLAQRLYEGVPMGDEGPVGLITYMRTDSTRVAASALEEAREFIEQRFGKNYLPPKAIHYRSKKGAQDAHEAIRPTSVLRDPASVKSYLKRDEFRLYTLIWNRFVASQMKPALFDQTEILITAGSVDFKAVGSVMKFDGFLKVYQGAETAAEAESSARLPQLKVGEKTEVIKLEREQKFTQPPARYNEASLVKALEEKGIGRPSTYQQILTVITSRDYVKKEKNRFQPTELGELVNDLLVRHFDEIFDYDYTAKLEKDLDRIEEGEENWIEALNRFYSGFKPRLLSAREQMQNLRQTGVPTDEKCEKCDSPMVIRRGRYGPFLSCSNYPKCRNTRELSKDANGNPSALKNGSLKVNCDKCGRLMVLKTGPYGSFLACSGYPECKNTKRLVEKDGETVVVGQKELEEKCPKCGTRLVLKAGRFGEFAACGNYPECRYIKSESTGVPCPKCKQGEIVAKRSRRGKVFYGCDQYPECDYVIWQKPVKETCPECGADYLLEKVTAKTGKIWYCDNRDCSYKIVVGKPKKAARSASSK